MYFHVTAYIHIFLIIIISTQSNCMTNKLILIRHGESMWNLANLFTGWADVALTPKGVEESMHAGKILRNNGLFPQISYTSQLQRSIDTNTLVTNQIQVSGAKSEIDVYTTWRLNERHYGKLTGHNREKQLWKGGYFEVPPNITPIQNLNIHPETEYNPIYGESFYMTFLRIMPLWDTIQLHVQEGKTPLICSHKNTLRVLMQHIENLDHNNIRDIDIPNATPIIYEFNKDFQVMNKQVLYD